MKTQHREYVKKKLLPSLKYCGLQHTDDRFYNETETALDEFPWLAHIVFIEDEDEDTEQYLDRCNGILINNKYVLTTEYCGTYAKSVRLGQYFTNKTISCRQDLNLQECTNPILEVPIVEEIHRTNTENNWHDFTLLRLGNKVLYSDFIRPICLPLNRSQTIPQQLYFSGWGSTKQGGIEKKRLIYKPTDIKECEQLDDKHLKNLSSEFTSICAVPKDQGGKFPCTGDEAGPLMYSYKHRWFADSLITRVYSKFSDNHYCSNELPITGIQITQNILNWVLDNMKA